MVNILVVIISNWRYCWFRKSNIKRWLADL